MSSEELTAFSVRAKKALRKKLRALRSSLPLDRAAERSAVICQRLLEHPSVAVARSVALFWPIVEKREVDLRPLHDALHLRGVRLAYPYMEPTGDGEIETGFRFVADLSELVDRGRSFAEPAPTAPRVDRGEVDVVIVPALAVTLDGLRLGYGSGFYDVTLPDVCPPARSIVVAYDFQRLVEIPTEPHDRRCDFVVTDAP
ncbi:MAG: 5-formyltetrahydrofolate cyclo-ligase [Polyangiaceae bacterium]